MKPSQSLPAAMRRIAVGLALACVLALPVCAEAQDEPPPGGGDAPAAPGPRAHELSGALRVRDIRRAASKVAAWQLARVEAHPSLDWTFAPLYLGFLSAAELLHEPRYLSVVQGVGVHFDWNLGPRVRHADDQAIAQAYLALYARHPDPSMLRPLRQRYDLQMRQPDDPRRPLWWWCDALFMAPPVWAGLARATGERGYLDYMDRQWWITSGLLYDPREHLFSRDASYLGKHERNGEKLFWGRGNGWVIAGLARVLDDLPADDRSRDRYLRQFREMSARLAALQGGDGLWRAGLLDPQSYPHPEVSGSAFITYALAWGVHHRVLDAAAYTPVIRRAWRGLVAQIYASGRLGNIQPIGAAPGQYPASASYVYGVGAFLLAAGEAAAVADQPVTDQE